jgi:hypothetical protein
VSDVVTCGISKPNVFITVLFWRIFLSVFYSERAGDSAGVGLHPDHLQPGGEGHAHQDLRRIYRQVQLRSFSSSSDICTLIRLFSAIFYFEEAVQPAN